MSDGVLPLTFAEPGRRTEIADPLLESISPIRAKSAGTSRRYVIALIADSLHPDVHAWTP
jgi:hypothetical protein